MKKYILLFLIVAFPVFSFAQDGANAKKPSVDGKKNEEKTESSTENNKVDQTEVITKDYVKGEPIELYDLIYMLLPDEGETSIEMFDLTKLGNTEKLDVLVNKKLELNNSLIFSKDSRGTKDNFWYSVCIAFRDDSKKGTQFECDNYMNLQTLLPQSNYSSKLIRQNGCSSGYGEALYEIKITGKKSLFLSIDYNSGIGMGEYGNKFIELEMMTKENEMHTDQESIVTLVENSYESGQPIELYDLIYILLPDLNSNGDFVKWEHLENYRNLFSVDKGEYDVRFAKGYQKYGQLENHNLIVPTKNSNSEEDSGFLNFIGTEVGYKSIKIFAASCIQFDDYDLNSLFKNREFTKELIEECDSESISQNDLYCKYKISFPNKRPFGLLISGSQCGGRNHFGDDLFIKCFINVDDAKENQY